MEEEAPVTTKLVERKTEKAVKRRKTISPSPERAPTLPPLHALPNRAAKIETRDISSSPEPQIAKVSTLLDRTNAQIAELKASMKRNVPMAPVEEKKKSALEQLIPETSIRGRKRKAGGATSDKQALDILKAFRSKLDQAPSERPIETSSRLAYIAAEDTTAGVDNDDEAALCDLHFIADCQSCASWDKSGEGNDPEEEDGDLGWMSHALSFKADKLGKDLSYRKKAEDELVVIDPREKARTLKEEKKSQRDSKANGGSRAWDQERNAKMARASVLAGRGAK